MKVLYLSSSVVPSESANSVHVMRMCQALARVGHDVELVARFPAESRQVDDPFAFYGIQPVFRLTRKTVHGKKWENIRYWLYGGTRYRKTRPDVVYGRDMQASCQAALRGAPVILEVHELATLSRRPHYRMAFNRIIRSRAFRHVVVISQLLAEDLIAAYPELRGRVVVAHDAADSIDPGRLVGPVSDSGSMLTVGYVGSLYPGRGLEMILALANRLPWAQFQVAGSAGPGIDSSEWPSNIRYLGHLSFPEAENIRLSSDVLIAPYADPESVKTAIGVSTGRWMSPMKLFEYMASGKAIVCSDLPVIREVLEPDRTALLRPPGDLEGWAEAITHLRDNPGLRRELGERARAEQVRSFTWQARARRVLEL